MENYKNLIAHKTAIIDEGATIGNNCKIWHWTHICKGAKIGDNCSFGQNVFIGNNVVIGNNVKVQNNVSIYDNVILEDDVFCGPSMVFTNVYNPRSKIIRKKEFKTTNVGKGTTLGANCTIICGINLGRHSFIAAGAVLRESCKNYSLMAGVPAKQIGWMSTYGEQIKLPLKGSKNWICPHTKEVYFLKDDQMFMIDS